MSPPRKFADGEEGARVHHAHVIHVACQGHGQLAVALPHACHLNSRPPNSLDNVDGRHREFLELFVCQCNVSFSPLQKAQGIPSGGKTLVGR